MRKATVSGLTPDEYLKLEETAELRHEYVDGELFAMTGETQAHNSICLRLSSSISAHLKGSCCHVFMNALKVHVKSAKCYYYPDIVVTCEPYKAKSLFVEKPVLIIEVLSPSTQHIDRREKLLGYRQLPSLREYILISATRRAVVQYQKEESGNWIKTPLNYDEQLIIESLPSGPLQIDLQELYGDLDLPSSVHEPEEEYAY